MRDSRPLSIENLFGNVAKTSCVSLVKIQQHAMLLLKLNRAVKELLPIQMRPWCHVSNVRQGVLILETANASWLLRLRYEQNQLLSALRAQILSSLSSINIRINPDLARKKELSTQNKDSGCLFDQPVSKQQRHLSIQSAAYIRHVTTYSEGRLKKALERLAELAGGECTDPACQRK